VKATTIGICKLADYSVWLKDRQQTHYFELVFLHLVGYAGHVVHYGTSGSRNFDALFFMLGWDWYGFHKKHAGTRYAELGFLHPLGSASHVVHFGASEAQNTNALFSMLVWASVVSIKNASETVTTNLCFCIRWDLWVILCIMVRPGCQNVVDALFYARVDPVQFA
jgi:hypothetical protein